MVYEAMPVNVLKFILPPLSFLPLFSLILSPQFFRNNIFFFPMIRTLYSLYNKLMVYKHRRYVLGQVKAGMHLGKNVMICPGVKFDPPHSFLLSIGDNCIIAPDVRFLNHDAALFGTAGFARIGKITINDNCFIGAGSLLMPGIIIGANAIVGAYSVVTKDVEPDTIVAGNPAKPIKKVTEYTEQCKKQIDTNEIPHFQSSELYSKLYDRNYKKSIIERMDKGIAFTIGGDHDYTYHFNRS
jgi:maltose O-acetyltransferase